MRTIINHDLRCADGVTLFLPPSPLTDQISLAQPDVYAESSTPLYPIGTLAWYAGMGKKFRYSKAGTALAGVHRLVGNANRPPTATAFEDVHGFYDGDSIATWAIGATEFTFIDTVDKVKDAFAGAHLLHFDAARDDCFEDGYIISGPPTNVMAGGNITVQFHKPRKYAKLSGDGIEIWLNPYSNISKHDVAIRQFMTFMGVPTVPIQNGFYFWLQTAGPVFITPNGWSTLCSGYAANSRVVYVHQDGGITTCTDAAGQGDQRIGELLCMTLAGSADAWLNMDLDLGH